MKTELITYTVAVEGDTYVVENVPARVDETTGEPFFTPDTVDRLQAILEKQMAEREHDEWVEFSMQNFARAYGDDEPDYSLEDINRRRGTDGGRRSEVNSREEAQEDRGSAFARLRRDRREW